MTVVEENNLAGCIDHTLLSVTTNGELGFKKEKEQKGKYKHKYLYFLRQTDILVL